MLILILKYLILFKNSSSDSLDLDFSEGVIDNVSFINSENDAIDMSGGKVKMKNIYITGAGDKAISSGEKNILIGNDIVLTKNAIGIASKDLSNISLQVCWKTTILQFQPIKRNLWTF